MPSASCIARPGRLAGVLPAVVVAVILALLATAQVSAAQGPPPEMPPPPTDAGGTPSGEQPPETQPPADQPADLQPPELPTGPASPPAEPAAPPASPGPAATVPPTAPEPVALMGSSTLRGRTLAIGLSCTRDGTVTVSYRGKRVGSAVFRCSASKATARVRFDRSVVRTIRRSASGSLKVTARAGDHTVTRILRFSRGRAQAAAWPRGAHGYFNAAGYCDYDFDHGRVLYKFSGLLTSPLAGGDRYWLRFWAYTHEGAGWQRITGWLGAHDVPLQGQGAFTWAVYDLFYPARRKWTAGYMEVWSYRHGRAFGDYLLTDQLGGGGITTTTGVWCYSQA
jgi:hypothetical protein